MKKKNLFLFILSSFLVLILSNCSDSFYHIGGNVSGLTETVVLQNNNSNDLTITKDGDFTFSSSVVEGQSYEVTVKTQPEGQTCVVTNDSGTVKQENISDVVVTCTDNVATITSSSGADSPAVLYGTNMNWLGNDPSSYVIFYCTGETCDINDNTEIPTGPITATSMETDGGSWSGYTGAICPANETTYNAKTCSNKFFTP